MPIDPVLKVPTEVPADAVSGILQVSEEFISFTPSEPLQDGMEYEVVITTAVKGAQGETLPEEISFRFITTLSPMYVDVKTVRTDLGFFIEAISDMDVAVAIYGASVQADEFTYQAYGKLKDNFLGELQLKQSNANLFHEFVRWEAAVRLLTRVSAEHMMQHGEKTMLGDLSYTFSGSMTPDISVMLKQVRERRDQALQRLTFGLGTFARPGNAVRGGSSNPYPIGSRVSF
jgi:hypothetical protein